MAGGCSLSIQAATFVLGRCQQQVLRLFPPNLPCRSRSGKEVREFLRGLGVCLDSAAAVIRQARVTTLADSATPADLAAVVSDASGLGEARLAHLVACRRAASLFAGANSALACSETVLCGACLQAGGTRRWLPLQTSSSARARRCRRCRAACVCW